MIMVPDKITFTDKIRKGGSVVVGVYADGSLSPNAAKIDKDLGGIISKSLKKPGFAVKTQFKTRSFVCPDDNRNHVIITGLGDRDKEYARFEAEKLGAAVWSGSAELDEEVIVAINEEDVRFSDGCVSAFMAFGALLKSWNFDKYKSEKDDKIKLRRPEMLSKNKTAAEKQFAELRNVAEGIFLTRLVVSEPANVIYPTSLAEVAKNELIPLGAEVEILKTAEMKKLGMNALLAVAQGSQNEPRLAILRWNGGSKSESSAPTIAFIGKGVTFDSGGISLKPGDGMHEMRCDMAGSGTVLGLVKAAALNKLPVNIVGLMAMVENMPSGSAQRPGDVVKSMSGQTIEVLNTDAEGRMVLADALWYAKEKFNPEIMVDFATLTGAIVVALGHEFAGLFSNCDVLAEQISKSGTATGEKLWRMPMSKHFDEGINSDIADMQNTGKPDVRGGSITAAQFLKRFVGDKKWAHIDIAGVETSASEDLFICQKGGATGFGVHLMYDFLRENYAK
ncbi:MAG: leucyl aminopeptidase [Holosporaceae bacterium]|jgi:leucyl aminopeptidase|nr:leucyl aminopeptidase [Holosporaceae bacterium]